MDNSKSTENLTNEVKLEEKKIEETTQNVVVENESSNSDKSEEKTENKVTENSTEQKVEEVKETKEETKEEKKEDEIVLTHLNKDFTYELMSIPTVSAEEYRLVTFVILWARRNNIHYEFDKKGNIYLTKGKLSEGEFYPCVTAHLDSVQHKHKPYAQVGVNLEVKTRVTGVTTKKHEIYVEDMGIGGDDKAGVLIGLSMFSHVDKLKACFFLEEETGCLGSKELNKEWFENVGYVMGYDSPDLNRAAYECSGVRLFDKEFFVTHMQEICKKHGLTKFFSEPYTDVKEIRLKTDIICMNFGSGYYNGHMPNEYCVLEDMDNGCRMGHELIQHLGNKRYEMKKKTTGWKNGTYTYDEDDAFFRSLSGYSYGYYNSGNGGTSYNGGSYNNTDKYKPVTTAQQTTVKKDDENMVDIETVKYISERYEEYVKIIKDGIMKKCESNNIDFSIFKEVFSNEIKF